MTVLHGLDVPCWARHDKILLHSILAQQLRIYDSLEGMVVKFVNSKPHSHRQREMVFSYRIVFPRKFAGVFIDTFSAVLPTDKDCGKMSLLAISTLKSDSGRSIRNMLNVLRHSSKRSSQLSMCAISRCPTFQIIKVMGQWCTFILSTN